MVDASGHLIFLKRTSYATVYQVGNTGRALKKFNDDDVQIREILNLKLLNCSPHKYVIRAEIIEQNDSICIDMPLYAGDLFTIGKLSKRTNLIRFVDQITSALAFLHNTGIVHRDIKPGNILISDLNEDNTDFILTDMGSSRLRMYGDGGIYTDEATTRIYQAPELWLDTNKGKFTPETDAWALGAVIFELQHGVHLIDPVVLARKREPLLQATKRSGTSSPDERATGSCSSPCEDNISLDLLDDQLRGIKLGVSGLDRAGSGPGLELSRSRSDSAAVLLNKPILARRSSLKNASKNDSQPDKDITSYFLVMQKLAQHVQLNGNDINYLTAYNNLRVASGSRPIKLYAGSGNDVYAGNSFIRLNPAERSTPTKHKPGEAKITSFEIFDAYRSVIPEWNPATRGPHVLEPEVAELLVVLRRSGIVPLPPTELFISDQARYLNKKIGNRYSKSAIAIASAIIGFMYFQAKDNIEEFQALDCGINHGLDADTFSQLLFDTIFHSAPLFRI